MKTLLLLLLCILTALTSTAAITIRVEASFGAKKKDCHSGRGICSARKTDGLALVGTTTLTLSDDETQLILTMDPGVIDHAENLLIDGAFVQEEDFQLPPELAKAFGHTAAWTIPAGTYIATTSEDAIRVVFPLGDCGPGIK